MSIIKTWKKVYEADLSYVANDLKESISKPSLIILTGEMGVGKTTFAKTFANDENIQSQSYSLISEAKSILHADFYRLENPEEIIHLELNLYLEGKEFFLVEWGRKYLNSLLKEVNDQFYAYELTILLNESTDKTLPPRDFTLSAIERI